MTDAVDSAVFGEAAIARAEDVATEQRFEALVIEHSRLVFRVAFAASRRVQDAEDAVQEVFFRGCLNCAWDGILGICRKLARRLLRDIAALRCCGLAPLMTLGDTLLAWREEIAAIWRFTRNKGITEGSHTKMEVLQRQAYGVRNFQNYRLRVKVMCS